MMQSLNKNNFMKSDVTLYGMFISVALVLSYIESIIPIPVPVPGIKLGLANVVILWILYSMGVKPAAFISIIRVIIANFLFGNLYGMIFSGVGAVLSLIVMYLLKKTGKFSIIGVSIAGGAAHNIGQVIVAVVVLQNIRMGYYLPILLVSGLVTGIAIGVLGGLLYKKIKILQTNVHL